MEFPLTDRSHAVMTLPVHLEGDHAVVYDENENDDNVAVAANKPSKLMAWFNLNETDVEARQFTYKEIPEHYVWDNKEGVWRKRRQVSKMIGQLMEVSPQDVELFHLRIILNHKQGSTSFDDLHTVNERRYETLYYECRKMGLIEDISKYENCLNEIAQGGMPPRLGKTFATYCYRKSSHGNRWSVGEI